MRVLGVLFLALLAAPSALTQGNVSDIAFLLLTRENPIEYQVLRLDDPQSLSESNFDAVLPTKIFIHGWNGNPREASPIPEEYLARQALNFIAVDWTALSAGLNYPLIAAQNVPLAGDRVALFLDFLIGQGVPLASLHVIGHSLGAHVSGNVGENLRSGRLPRITGLDPAGPGFQNVDPSLRLDVSDAVFLDVVQTNSGTLLEGGVGYGPPMGHVDFYPNGGDHQPGCPGQSCDHRRCVDYFAESINSPQGFLSLPCDSWELYVAGSCAGNGPQLLMGDPTPSTARGVYYLETNAQSPYARG